MKKLLKKITLSVLTLLSVAVISSCSKSDNDGSDLKGFWVSPRSTLNTVINHRDVYVDYIRIYEFVNGNTVKTGLLFDTPDGNSSTSPLYVTLNGHESWYNWKNVSELKTYTYTYHDGKVIIPMRGEILTVSGKTMVSDGGSEVYTKTKAHK